jgi:hypothetical protein
MLDPRISSILETAINSSCKLAIAVVFAERPTLRLTSVEIAERVYRDRWSVEAALADLTREGVLDLRESRYGSAPAVRADLRLLQDHYVDPLIRMELLRVLREVERYAPYRHELPSRILDKIAA